MGCVKVVFIAHRQDEPVDIEAAKKRPRPEWQLDCRNPRKSVVNGSQEKRTIPRNRDDWMIKLPVVGESKNANGWYLMSDSPLILRGAG